MLFGEHKSLNTPDLFTEHFFWYSNRFARVYNLTLPKKKLSIWSLDWLWFWLELNLWKTHAQYYQFRWIIWICVCVFVCVRLHILGVINHFDYIVFVQYFANEYFQKSSNSNISFDSKKRPKKNTPQKVKIHRFNANSKISHRHYFLLGNWCTHSTFTECHWHYLRSLINNLIAIYFRHGGPQKLDFVLLTKHLSLMYIYNTPNVCHSVYVVDMNIYCVRFDCVYRFVHIYYIYICVV